MNTQTTNGRTRIDSKAFLLGDLCCDTMKTHLPAMGSLFDKLTIGEEWGFLDVMSALSEMVAFYTEPDTKSGRSCSLDLKMSQKKCRFCD